MSTNPKIHKHNVRGNNLIYSILLNTLITIAQVIGGIVSGSLALISDALHNFSDVLSLIFSLVAHKLSRRKASISHTFGYKRAELIAAFINGINCDLSPEKLCATKVAPNSNAKLGKSIALN